MILLIGCSRQQQNPEVVRTEVVVLKPGTQYLIPSRLPPQPVTYRDYISYKYQCDAVVAKCNVDKESIADEYERTIQRESTSK